MNAFLSQSGASVEKVDAEKVTDKYLPVSLQARGYALPFTTGPVAFARIRQGNAGLEIILPGLADGLIAHVVAFERLPDLVSLTVFDRALYEAIGNLADQSALNPAAIRKLRMEIGETGLGGMDMMRMARSKRVVFVNMAPAILNALAERMIKQHGPDKNIPKNNIPEPVNMATEKGRQIAALKLEGFAKNNGLDQKDVIDRLVDISWTMQEFGGPLVGMNGPIRDILTRMQSFSEGLRQWLISEPIEEAEMAQRISMALLATIDIAAKYVKQLESVYEKLDQTVLSWDELRENVNKTRDQIDRLIDGWERILDLRDAYANAQRFRQRECLASLAPFVPIPAAKYINDGKETWLDLRRAQLRWLGRIKYLKDMKNSTESILRHAKREIL